MFEVKENECVGFESKWKVTKICAETSAQTSEFSVENVETATASTTEMETQTDSNNEAKAINYDEQKLADWLGKVYPAVTRELTDVVTTQAFKNYHPSLDNIDGYAKLLQTITVNEDAGEGDTTQRISSLSWNSTGNTIAVSCNHVHKTWCRHNGIVGLYTFDRNDTLPSSPQKKITTRGCITSLKFHPDVPFIIAGGTHSGEIFVWNIQQDNGDNLIAKVDGHDDCITQISWVHDINPTKTLLLVSSSLDGFINVYNFNAQTSLNIKKRYKIKTPMFGKTHREKALPENIAKKVERGVISFDFSKHIPSTFIVAAEGGLIAQCSMVGARPLKGSTHECPILDPITKYYSSHEGEISCISFSPNRKEMFLSNGFDGQIRIYVIDQDDPAKIIFVENSLQFVSWIPHEEKLIVACGSKGCIEIFNVLRGTLIPNITKETFEPSIASQLEINMKRATTVAVGTVLGKLQLWTVPWGLFARNR